MLESIAPFFALIRVSYLCVFYVNNTFIRSSAENTEAVDALIIIIVENPRSSFFSHFYSCLIHALKFFFKQVVLFSTTFYYEMLKYTEKLNNKMNYIYPPRFKN